MITPMAARIFFTWGNLWNVRRHRDYLIICYRAWIRVFPGPEIAASDSDFFGARAANEYPWSHLTATGEPLVSLFNELKRRNVLRVAAAYIVASWLIVQVVETVFPAFGFSDAAVRIAVIVLAIGFLPVLVFAWAFELTPDGLKREQDVDRSRSVTPEAGRKLDRIIMVMLALGLAYFAFDKFVLSASREASIAETARRVGRSEALVESFGDASIAVLPFDNISDDPSNEYFSDGITEEILNLLSKIPELRVVSRSSAFAYKDKEIHVPEVAATLNVANILEGSVRKAGNRVRITAQLIDARSDTHLWSETYDRTLEDVFAVQDEIAAAVSEALKLELVDGPPSAAVTDTQAHEYYLQAVYFYNRRSSADYKKALEYLEKTLAEDPDYVPAWITLSSTYAILANSEFMPYDEGYGLSIEAVDEAAKRDPDSPHAIRCWIAMMYEHDYVGAARHCRRALELQPNSVGALNNAAVLTQIIGRREDSITFLERAIKLSPTDPIPYVNLASRYTSLGMLDEAEAAAMKALELNPHIYSAPVELASVSLFRGDPEQALQRAEGIQRESFARLIRAIARYDLGQVDESNRELETLIADYADTRAYYIAMVYAWRPDNDQAFEWLDRAIDENQNIDALKTEPLFRNLYDDSRWEETLMRVGLADSQVSEIEFDVALSD
jgi:adenylate cyclase